MLRVLCAGPASQGCCYRRFTQISVCWTDICRAAFLCTVGHRYFSHPLTLSSGSALVRAQCLQPLLSFGP